MVGSGDASDARLEVVEISIQTIGGSEIIVDPQKKIFKKQFRCKADRLCVILLGDLIKNTKLSFLAIPYAGSVFYGWNGDCSMYFQERCVITITPDQTNYTITGLFEFAEEENHQGFI